MNKPITEVKVKSPIHFMPRTETLRIWPAEAEMFGPQIAIQMGGGHYGNARIWVDGKFAGTIHFQGGRVYCGHDLGGKAHWAPYATEKELDSARASV